MQGLLASLDILASTSIGHSPAFALRLCSDASAGLFNVEHATGCDAAVMQSIMSISELQRWKVQQRLDGQLSLLELAQRALEVESTLSTAQQNNLALMEGARGASSRIDEIRIITNIFARAARVYLHTIVSGAHPEVFEIKSGVAETIAALRLLPRAEMIANLTWPICVAACVASVEQRGFFERLERGVIDEYGRSQRVLRAFAIARECWRLRESGGGRIEGKAYDWRDGMASLGQTVMLF